MKANAPVHGMKHTTTEAPIHSPPSPEEIRPALELVLASGGFRRSERHARFLRFVCETTLNGDGGKLNEYLIAHDVFGRGDEYTPSEDSIVRRQAHSLRQKLQEYYTGEGADAPIRIELPIGRYIPHFVRSHSPVEVPEAREAIEPMMPVAAPVTSRWRGPIQVAGAAICGLVLFAAGWAIGHRGGTARTFPVSRAMSALWSPWVANGGDAMICFSSPLTTVVKQFDTALPPHVQPVRISVNADQDRQLREAFNLPPGGFIYLSPAISQSKVGEAVGSIALIRFLTTLGIPTVATQSRLMSWEDFRAHNLILLGHDEANRWLDPILSKLPLRLGTNPVDKVRRIINTAPEGNSPAEYFIKYPLPKGHSSDDYALVSMIPGIDGKHELLLVNGVNTEGTQMAMEYLSDPLAVESLLKALQAKAPNHVGSWHFQLVLRAEVRDKVPTRAELLFVKVL
jgi:hypothetical protein